MLASYAATAVPLELGIRFLSGVSGRNVKGTTYTHVDVIFFVDFQMCRS